MKAQVEQTETCRRAGVRDTRLASAANLQKLSCQKFRNNNIIYAAPTGIKIDCTSMILHVKSYALKYMISGISIRERIYKVKTRLPLRQP